MCGGMVVCVGVCEVLWRSISRDVCPDSSQTSLFRLKVTWMGIHKVCVNVSGSDTCASR